MIAALGATGDEPVDAAERLETTLREALLDHCCLSEVTERPARTPRRRRRPTRPRPTELRGLIDDDGPIAGFDVLDLLRRFPSARPSPRRRSSRSLAAIKPRLYSISSSPKRHAGQVHLTVRRVAYDLNGRTRKGVASTMLADRVGAGLAGPRLRPEVARVHARRPTPTRRSIMIGPGTGIAPFRAFLHERDALGATGKNWLFFGDQRSELDFLYEDELDRLPPPRRPDPPRHRLQPRPGPQGLRPAPHPRARRGALRLARGRRPLLRLRRRQAHGRRRRPRPPRGRPPVTAG